MQHQPILNAACRHQKPDLDPWLFSQRAKPLDDFHPGVPQTSIRCFHIKKEPDLICDFGVALVGFVLLKFAVRFFKKPGGAWPLDGRNIFEFFSQKVRVDLLAFPLAEPTI